MDNIKRQTLEVAAITGKDNSPETENILLRTRRQPSKGWAWPKVRELWEYRELL